MDLAVNEAMQEKCIPVKFTLLEAFVRLKVRIGKWPWPRGVAYGVSRSNLFKTPMRFLLNVHPAYEFYHKLAAFEWATEVSTDVGVSTEAEKYNV
ncbi:hypothetical protein ANTPLA_LOCUS2537 [Anthophora plagiata]